MLLVQQLLLAHYFSEEERLTETTYPATTSTVQERSKGEHNMRRKRVSISSLTISIVQAEESQRQVQGPRWGRETADDGDTSCRLYNTLTHPLVYCVLCIVCWWTKGKGRREDQRSGKEREERMATTNSTEYLPFPLLLVPGMSLTLYLREDKCQVTHTQIYTHTHTLVVEYSRVWCTHRNSKQENIIREWRTS